MISFYSTKAKRHGQGYCFEVVLIFEAFLGSRPSGDILVSELQ